MKTVCSLLLLHFLCANLIAQEDVAKNYSPELGLNFTLFLDEAIDFGGNNTPLSSYLFTYKKLDESGTGLRLGAGLDFGRRKEKENDGNNSLDNSTFVFSSYDLRIGKEWQHKISDRWAWYLGLDWVSGALFQSVKSKDDNGDTTTSKFSRFGMGGGPVLGFQFMLAERVGVSTEASLYLRHDYSVQKSEFDGNGQDDEKDTVNNTGMSFNLPTNIYVFIRF